MSRAVTTLAIVLLLTSACANPAADKPQGVTGEAAPVASAPATGERYSIWPQASKIEFVGSKVTGSHNGSFERFSGDIDYQGQPEKSRVRITIDLNSITTDEAQLTEHLKTADFFDVAKYPQATFESTEIKAGGEKGATHTVTGNLQMHGVTKSITFPATIAISSEGATVDSSFAINRKDFGIMYEGKRDDLIRDDVVLTLRIRATKA